MYFHTRNDSKIFNGKPINFLRIEILEGGIYVILINESQIKFGIKYDSVDSENFKEFLEWFPTVKKQLKIELIKKIIKRQKRNLKK